MSAALNEVMGLNAKWYGSNELHGQTRAIEPVYQIWIRNNTALYCKTAQQLGVNIWLLKGIKYFDTVMLSLSVLIRLQLQRAELACYFFVQRK